MGSKVAARELCDGGRSARRAWRDREPISRTPESSRGRAALGFPVLVKASAGGGGKGMRAVRDRNSARDLIAAARREAVAAFGDGTLYVERLIDKPRHVEVQIFGDHHGNIMHLFERECSIQRRHQKILEESPSPALTPLRARSDHGSGRRGRSGRRLRQRRHDRVPARRLGRRRAVLFSGGEHAAAGRASRDRGASPGSIWFARSSSSRPEDGCRGHK